jgi:hypothetical protein
MDKSWGRNEMGSDAVRRADDLIEYRVLVPKGQMWKVQADMTVPAEIRGGLRRQVCYGAMARAKRDNTAPLPITSALLALLESEGHDVTEVRAEIDRVRGLLYAAVSW